MLEQSSWEVCCKQKPCTVLQYATYCLLCAELTCILRGVLQDSVACHDSSLLLNCSTPAHCFYYLSSLTSYSEHAAC